MSRGTRGHAGTRILRIAPKLAAFSCLPGKAQAFLWDSDVPGLALRATANGAKAFVFQSRFQGRDIRMTIGSRTCGR
jgi:hypothetical protein